MANSHTVKDTHKHTRSHAHGDSVFDEGRGLVGMMRTSTQQPQCAFDDFVTLFACVCECVHVCVLWGGVV